MFHLNENKKQNHFFFTTFGLQVVAIPWKET